MKMKCILLLIAQFLSSLSQAADNVIHINAYTPYYLNDDRHSYKAALDTGVQLLNEKKDILPNHTIEIHYEDDYRKKGLAMNHAMSTIRKKEYPLQYVFGPFNIESYLLTHIVTDNFHVPHNDLEVGLKLSSLEALVQMLRHFNWARIAIFTQINDKFIEEDENDEIVQYLKKNGVEALHFKLYHGGISSIPYDRNGQRVFEDINDMLVPIQKIKENDIRIIIFNGIQFPSWYYRAYCLLRQNNMVFPRYQTVMIEKSGYVMLDQTQIFFYPGRLKMECTLLEIFEAMESTIRIAPQKSRSFGSKTDYGNKTVGDVFEMLKINHDKNKQWLIDTIRAKAPNFDFRRLSLPATERGALYLVDEIYRMGMAFDSLLKQNGDPSDVFLDTKYNNVTKMRNFYKAFNNVNFLGVVGDYNPQSIREGRHTAITFQKLRFTFNARKPSGLFSDIGSYQLHTGDFQWFESIKSHFKNGSILTDRMTRLEKRVTYNDYAWITSWSVNIFGIVCSIVIFFLNNVYRNIKALKLTSPVVNNVMIFGSVLCYLSMIFYGMDTRFVVAGNVTAMCSASTVSLVTGFSIVFGSLFGKTWRIYRIFTSSRHNKKMKLKDYHIILFVAILLCIDIAMMASWFTVSPYETKNIILSSHENKTLDIITTEYFQRCESIHNSYFLTAIIIEKAVFLILGIFLAWETRKVNIPVLNDSRYIASSIYVVAITAIAGTIATVTLHSTEHYNEVYLILSIVVYVATTSTIFLAMLPKLTVLFGKNTLERQRTASTSSLAVKNATEELKSQKKRQEKLQAVRKYNAAVSKENRSQEVEAMKINPGYSASQENLKIKVEK
ncbi:gamma-aminobutyric acid type B receptor subunit 2-like [Clytia hemisphaerica]|uniref:G-protein coupled receptors family 3 profile domain-containing protein n=1 Tax=Clytia hemisphaerica TaxID=252671 RepID=A0A7M5XKM7_9CNID